MNLYIPIIVFLLSSFLFSCGFLPEKNELHSVTDKPFEGEIILSESRGLYGSLFKVNTSYLISEKKIKREQKLGGLNEITNTLAGIIVDLEKDSVTLYFSNSFTKNKHTLSVKEYKKRLAEKSLPVKTPSPVDNTFNFLQIYQSIKTAKDTLVIEGFKADYNLFKDGFMQQETFDTKSIKVNRELLQMVFINLPGNINFPLKSQFKTAISSTNNDSIINSDGARQLDKLSRSVIYNKDSLNKNEETDLKMLSKNKILNLGLEVLKVGVDLNIHITSEPSEVTFRTIEAKNFWLPSGDFIEVDNFDGFFDSLPSGGGGD